MTPQAVTPGFLVSALAATILAASLIVSVLAYRRTSRMQDADYRPHISFDHGKLAGATEANESDDEEPIMFSDKLKYEGTITNAGTKPVQLLEVRVLIRPRKQVPDVALIVPLGTSVAPGAHLPVSYELPWSTVWSIAKRLNAESVDWDMKVKMIGADRVTREQDSHVGSLIRCEEFDWLALERTDEVEAAQMLYHWSIRARSKRNAEAGRQR